MNIIEILILALALSMDAFAVSIVLGLKMKKTTLKRVLIVALYFGLFQAVMPLIGYFIASLFADAVQAAAHWIAFALLLILGAKMIFGVIREKIKAENEAKEKNKKVMSGEEERETETEECARTKEDIRLTPKKMIPYAVATSIDALAIGVSFAVLYVNIFSAVAIIGAITFCLCLLAVKLGSILGERVKSKAEIVGGVVLILLAVNVVLGHFGLLPF